MADGDLGHSLQPTVPVAHAPDRRSGRKRKAVESYATNDSLSSDDVVKAPTQPARKRKKSSPTDLTGDGDVPSKASAGLKSKAHSKPTKAKAIDFTSDDDAEQLAPIKGKAKGKGTASSKDEEKRMKRFRKAIPQSYQATMSRAVTQRMFIVDRKRHNNDQCPHSTPDCPIEVVDLAGSTGNIYTVTIEHVPTCTCPNFVKGNPQCKHILYVLVKVLKAPGELQYQAAFLTTELREIFDHAGPLPSESISAEDKDGKRKPIEGDCPICVEELDPKTEEIVWCHAACGNNLHKTCFDQWAASKRGTQVTCPYCRTVWEAAVDEQALKNVSKTGPVGNEGYVNIAGQLGISGRRDYSSYHSYWVRREHRAGNIDNEDAAGHYDYYPD